MLEHIITYIAPHHCVRCNTQDTLLCEFCQQVTLKSYAPVCVLCNNPTRISILCTSCQVKSPFDNLWASGQYDGALEMLLKRYKFERARSADAVFASLLDRVIPSLPAGTVVTYAPTARSRVRQRGYDQVERVARKLAAKRNLEFCSMFGRRHSKRQLGAGRKERLEQAQNAFELVKPVLPKPYLIIDDVMTTGATLSATAKLLRNAGAQIVFGSVIAHEPLK
jgi:ComF family protein